MKSIVINETKFEIPGSWDEFTTEQLVFLASVMREDYKIASIKTKLLFFCMKAKVRRFSAYYGFRFHLVTPKGSFFIHSSEVYELSEALGFIFRSTNKGTELNIRMVKNPMKTIDMNRYVLHGPDDGLTNITYGQFVMLQTWLQRINRGGRNIKYLDNFLAVLWKTEKFDTSEEGNPDLFKDIDTTVKTVMFWWYIGCMNFIQDRFPRVFSGGSAQGVDVFDQQQRIVNELAGGDVTKKEKVKSALLYDALYSMDEAINNKEKIQKAFK